MSAVTFKITRVVLSLFSERSNRDSILTYRASRLLGSRGAALTSAEGGAWGRLS